MVNAAGTSLRSSDDGLMYWRKGESEKNFGDFLAPYMKSKTLLDPIVPVSRYWLLGSVIDNGIIDHVWSTLEADVRQSPLIFWCCGKRDDNPLDSGMQAHCRFAGVRGPLTRTALGLPLDTPIGDPALLLPILYTPKPCEHAGKVVAVPHFYDPLGIDDLKSLSGADVILSTHMQDYTEIELLIDAIASARLVLAGSLHAAITAFAYGVPFVCWNTGFIDVPFKWLDFAALINIENRWAATVEEADRQPIDLTNSWRPTMTSLLGCCPLSVRPSVVARAVAYDARLDPLGAETVAEIARTLDRLALT